MTSKNRQEEMVNTFVASIPTMQTDIALLKQDISTVKKQGETVLERLDALSVVSKEEFYDYKKEIEEQLNEIHKYNNANKPGVAFANAIVSRWTTFLVLLILAAAVVALIGKYVPLGG
tara:strand:- start:797 stop:1150 length:354 start_codon:yes stop_codon:yes gene_type:complete